MNRRSESTRPTGARRHRLRAALVAALTLTVALTGCVERADTPDQVADNTVSPTELSGLTLRVGDQKGGTEALLRSAGQLDDLPFRIEFSTFTSGPPQIEAATAGKIDFAVTGNTPPIFGAASQAKIKVVSAYSNNARGDAILVPQNSTIRSVADLKGKKVAVGKGSSAHGHLLLQLRRANLSIGPGKDVEPVFLQPADALSAFTARAVDAWAIWDPYTAIVELQDRPRTLTTAQGVSNGYGFGIAADGALADPKRNTAIRELVIRIAKASKWAGDHVDEWAQRYATAIGIDPRAARTAQGRSLRPAIELNDAVIGSEQQLTDVFVETGQIGREVSFADYTDRRYNEVLAPYFAHTTP